MRGVETHVHQGDPGTSGGYGVLWEVRDCPEEAGMRRSLETRGGGNLRGAHGRPAQAQGQAVPCGAFSHGVLSSPGREETARLGAGSVGDATAGARGACSPGLGSGAPLARGHPGQSPLGQEAGTSRDQPAAACHPSRPCLAPEGQRWAEASGEPAGGSHSVGSRLGRSCEDSFPPSGLF